MGSIRSKIVFWFAAMILPIMATGIFSFYFIYQQFSNRIEVDLANVHRLEAARIRDVLDLYKASASGLAASPRVIELLSKVERARKGNLAAQRQERGGDSDRVADPASFEQLANDLLEASTFTGSALSALRMVDSQGRMLGETTGYGWEPRSPSVVTNALEAGALRFGHAFRSEAGMELLAVVAPVSDRQGDVVGALIAEMYLGNIVDAVVEHEGFGKTSEAHIAQPTETGDAEFITLLRFARQAAFNKIVPKSRDLPINWSLVSPERRVVRSPDYRSAPSFLAIQTLPETGWGLVVKIDQNEAMAPVHDIGKLLIAVVVAFLSIFLLFSLLFLWPLAKRLEATSLAARRIARGTYQTVLLDKNNDELGDVGRSIDYLASNLAAERQKRHRVEKELRYMASHDELTGLMNRKTLTAVLKKRAAAIRHAPVMLFFIDLDKFKPVNDTLGHAAGDCVLKDVARRLDTLVGTNGLTSRWGGDEFVVAVTRADDLKPGLWAARMESVIRKPIVFDGQPLQIDSSIGIATAASSTDIDELIAESDRQMYIVKTRKPAGRKAA